MGNSCITGQKAGEKTNAFSVTNQRRKRRDDALSIQSKLFVANPPNRNVFDSYEVIKVIGEGSMGTIMKVRRRRPHPHPRFFDRFWRINNIRQPIILEKEAAESSPEITYALKAIQKDQVNELFHSEMRNEISILQHLDHPNIVRIFESFEHKRQIYLVMEYCCGGDLYERCDPYSEQDTARIVTKLLSAVAYMHLKGVVHRDLKFENILFENKRKDANIKIIDFGLSKKFKQTKHGNSLVMTELVGTLYTMAPQVLQRVYTSQADIWAVGVITYMMLSGHKPFWAKRRKYTIDKIMRCDYNFNDDIWLRISGDAKEFISNCLQMDPNDRPTAEEALKAKFLTKRLHHVFSVNTMIGVQESLVSYVQCNKLKQLALMVIAHKSSMDEVTKLRQVFSKYDKNKDGMISLTEFKSALSGSNFTDDDIDHMFNNLDVNKYGAINYTEFLAATLETKGRIETGRVAEAFDRFDASNSGYITKKKTITPCLSRT